MAIRVLMNPALSRLRICEGCKKVTASFYKTRELRSLFIVLCYCLVLVQWLLLQVAFDKYRIIEHSRVRKANGILTIQIGRIESKQVLDHLQRGRTTAR